MIWWVLGWKGVCVRLQPMGNLSAEWSDCLKLFFFFSVSRVCCAKKICKPEKLKTSICIIFSFLFSSSFWACARWSSEGEGAGGCEAVFHEQQHHDQPAARAHRWRSPPPSRLASHRPPFPGHFLILNINHALPYVLFFFPRFLSVSIIDCCSQQRTPQQQVTGLQPTSMGRLRPPMALHTADR